MTTLFKSETVRSMLLVAEVWAGVRAPTRLFLPPPRSCIDPAPPPSPTVILLNVLIKGSQPKAGRNKCEASRRELANGLHFCISASPLIMSVPLINGRVPQFGSPGAPILPMRLLGTDNKHDKSASKRRLPARNNILHRLAARARHRGGRSALAEN
jgi:hypothetical protein